MPQPKASELQSFLRSRRSIRRFKADEVPSDLLNRILETAMWAPNAHNAQSWRFVQLESRESRALLAEAMGAEFRLALAAEDLNEGDIEIQLARSRERILEAPELILVCVQLSGLKTYKDEARTRGEEKMAEQSAAMAGAQLLLAAHAEGLGAVWLCAPLFTPKELAQALEIPESWEAQGMIYLGYPAKQGPPRPRKALKDLLLKR